MQIAAVKLPCTWNNFSKQFEISNWFEFTLGLMSCKRTVRVKVVAPLSSADVKFLLNQKGEAKFAIMSCL